METLLRQLENCPATQIRLQSETDRLCGQCPHNCGGACETAEKTARYDRVCLELCGLEKGAVLSWEEFRELVRQKILRTGRREEVCGDCEWNEICQHRNVEKNV